MRPNRPRWLQNKIRRQKAERVLKAAILPQRVVREFLAKPRRDFRIFKKYSPHRLAELEQQLPIPMPYWDKLTRVQQACTIIGARERRFAFFNDTGTGKTFLLGALAEYFYQLGDVDHVLVLVPRKPNKFEWAAQLQKHMPKVPFVVLEGSTDNKLQQMEDNPGALIFIESYGGLPHIACKMAKPKGKRKQHLKPNESRLRKLRAFFQGVLTDEGINGGLGNKDTLPWRVCRQLMRNPDAIYFTATATPFGRDPIALWSQMWLVDNGYTLGANQAIFRSAFYSAHSNPFGGIEYEFLKRDKRILYDMIADGSISFDADEADLPRVVSDVIKVPLSDDAATYNEQAKRMLKEARGNYLETKNAFLRLRQISSGFMGFKDDDTGAKARLSFDDNPKLDMLLSKLEAIGHSYKSIVFYEYTYSGLLIKAQLQKLGIKACHLWGGGKDSKLELQRFNTDPDYPVMILQNTFGIGLNIQVAKYGWFYEAPVSPIMRTQCWKRIERQHSPHKTVFINDLVTEGTEDMRILAMLKQGRDLFEAIVKGQA